MSSLRDGLGYNEVVQSGLAGPASNHAYFLGSVTSESLITGTAIKGTTFSGTTFAGTNFTSAQGQLSPVGTGSPTTWGLGIQSGYVSGTNVPVVVTFGTAFRAGPFVTTQLLISGAQATNAGYVAGPTAAGSFVFMGVSGAPYSWVAIGSL